MRALRTAGWLGMVVMALAIAYGIASGGFAEDGRTIWSLPWGKVTLVDLFVGFGVVGAVIVWRERRPRRWLPWLVALLFLGNLVTAAYLLWALRDPERSSAT